MDRFGVPNKNELKRMNNRQLKKGRYGKYQQICAEVIINLNAPLTAEDVLDTVWTNALPDPEYVDILFGWLIPQVEKHNCFASCGTASFDKGIQTIEALSLIHISAPTRPLSSSYYVVCLKKKL